MVKESLLREKNDGSEIQDETINLSLNTFRNIISDCIRSYLRSENIERYADMKITKVNTVYKAGSTTEIDHYTYNVKDDDTGDIYEELLSRSSDNYEVGNLARVYISNIVYIGFKL